MSRISVSNNTNLYKNEDLPHGCELADKWSGIDNFSDFLKIAPMSVRNLNKRCRDVCHVYSCEQCYEKHKLAINMAIRKKQYENALSGDTACLYYIGKNILKDTEKLPIGDTSNDKVYNITILGGDTDLADMQKELDVLGKINVVLKNELIKLGVDVESLLKDKDLCKEGDSHGQ